MGRTAIHLYRSRPHYPGSRYMAEYHQKKEPLHRTCRGNCHPYAKKRW